MVFLFGVFHGTEEIVCRVSFEYNLAPLLKEERKEEDFKAANDRPFRVAVLQGGQTTSSTKEPCCSEEGEGTSAWGASKGSRVSLDTERSQKDHAAFPPSTQPPGRDGC